MLNISSVINLDSNFLNLKAMEIEDVCPKVKKLLVNEEIGVRYECFNIEF